MTVRYRKLADGTIWPTPGDDPDGGLEWRLRYAPNSLTRPDQLVLASIVSAYRQLLCCPTRRRTEVVRMYWKNSTALGKPEVQK